MKLHRKKYEKTPEQREHFRVVQKNWTGTHPKKVREREERFRAKNHERLLPYWRNWYYVHREKVLTYGEKRRALLRYLVLEKIGLQCRRCGEADLRVLQINHKNGGGSKEFSDQQRGRRTTTFYLAILSGVRSTDDLETLCANCNIIYDYEHGHRVNEPLLNEAKQFLLDNPQARDEIIKTIRENMQKKLSRKVAYEKLMLSENVKIGETPSWCAEKIRAAINQLPLEVKVAAQRPAGTCHIS